MLTVIVFRITIDIIITYALPYPQPWSHATAGIAEEFAVLVHRDLLESANDAKLHTVFGTTLAVTILSAIGVNFEEAILVSESCTNGIATSEGEVHTSVLRTRIDKVVRATIIERKWLGSPSMNDHTFMRLFLGHDRLDTEYRKSWKSVTASRYRGFTFLISIIVNFRWFLISSSWRGMHTFQAQDTTEGRRSRIQPPLLGKSTPSKEAECCVKHNDISTLHNPDMQTF